MLIKIISFIFCCQLVLPGLAISGSTLYGAGTVSGPASTTDDATACFDGTTGGKIKECTDMVVPNGATPSDNDACSTVGVLFYDTDGAAGGKLIICNGSNYINMTD